MTHSAQNIVNCPNCGGYADRHYIDSQSLIRTQCPHCDYLMITCSKTGNVVEAYAPGLPGLVVSRR